MFETTRVSLLTVSVVACAVLLAPGTAQAGLNPEPWEPWEQPEWRAEAGVYCDFAFHLEVISQDIERRTLDRFDDGTVRLEEYRGPLISEFVNEDNAKRLETDASGRLVMEYYPGGNDKAMTTIGPVGNGFKDGDGYPRGYYVMEGFHHVVFDPDGTEHMAIDGGAEIDVCEQLS